MNTEHTQALLRDATPKWAPIFSCGYELPQHKSQDCSVLPLGDETGDTVCFVVATGPNQQAKIKERADLICARAAPALAADNIRLRAEIAELRKENAILEIKNAGTLANNLCPDCRDKQVGKPCLGCTIQTLERKRDRLAQQVAVLREALCTIANPPADSFDIDDAAALASAALKATEPTP